MADVVEHRDLAASSDEVWLALTTADGLRGWFWPARLQTAVEADAREGGRQVGQHTRGWSDCFDRLVEWLAAN